MSNRICITPETCNRWDKEVCVPWEQSQPGGSWHGWIPVLLFPEWMSTSEKCPVVTTANSNDFLFLPLHTLSFIRGRKNTSFSFSPTTFPKSCLQAAAHFPCVYPVQYLLLSLFLLEDQAGTLSDDGHIITTTPCSAVLNIHGSRRSGCLLAWASLIKKHKKHLGKSPHSSLKAVGTNLKKKIRTSNIQLQLFLD